MTPQKRLGVAPSIRNVAVVVAIVVTVAVLSVLGLARQGPRPTSQLIPASGPRIQVTPTPLTSPAPIALPTTVQLSAPSSNVVWAFVEYRYLARSTDRGTTWQQRPLPTSVEGFPRPEISFVNDHEGWLTAGGSPETQCNAEAIALWHTTDAGTTWKSLGTKGVSDRQCKEHPSFSSSNRGFLDGYDPNGHPVIYRTADGGRTWAGSRPLGDPPGFKTVGAGFALAAGFVRAFGSTLLVPVLDQAQATTAYVYRSTNGGATWTYLATIPRFLSPTLVTATRWIELVPPGSAVETTNAGRSWHPYESDYSQAAPIAPDVVFGSVSVGYASARGGITRTADGGLHWTDIDTPGV